jgi:hypothetical protein
VSEQAFRILFKFRGNVRCDVMFYPRSIEEIGMKKLGYAIAALVAIIVAAPSIASAETVVIKRNGYHHGYHHRYGARAEYRGHHDRGYHHGWRHGHRDKVVIIKKHRY